MVKTASGFLTFFLQPPPVEGGRTGAKRGGGFCKLPKKQFLLLYIKMQLKTTKSVAKRRGVVYNG
ncbi:hypothetical protein HMPREF0262_01233 [Clostridium sp. ATCC 29733]|nr:hypothetical protein HMPREF0262_01233 [Clostridium sp. ATCC 29733]